MHQRLQLQTGKQGLNGGNHQEAADNQRWKPRYQACLYIFHPDGNKQDQCNNRQQQ